eukprot:7231353-Alexandrium_andersonii.AAC.1
MACPPPPPPTSHYHQPTSMRLQPRRGGQPQVHRPWPCCAIGPRAGRGLWVGPLPASRPAAS